MLEVVGNVVQVTNHHCATEVIRHFAAPFTILKKAKKRTILLLFSGEKTKKKANMNWHQIQAINNEKQSFNRLS